MAQDLRFIEDGHDGDFVLKKPRAAVVSVAEMLPAFLDKLEKGEPPVVWHVDDRPWGKFAFRPGRVVVVGGPTNVGKTAFAVDVTMRALARNPEVRAVLATVEEDPEDLLCRGIAGLIQLPVSQLRERRREGITDSDIGRVRDALEDIGPRLFIVKRPFTLDEVIMAAEDFGANIVMLDYLQELRLSDWDGDLMEKIRRIMPMLRSLADRGQCVLAMSALTREGARQVDGLGGRQNFSSSDLAVFHGGMPIEYAMNEGYLLLHDRGRRSVAVAGDHDDAPLPMWLQHLKSRSDVTQLVPLWFEGRYQRFVYREVSSSSGSEGPASLRGQFSGEPQGPARGKSTPVPSLANAKPPRKEAVDDHWLT
jgi:hypothetical protein